MKDISESSPDPQDCLPRQDQEDNQDLDDLFGSYVNADGVRRSRRNQSLVEESYYYCMHQEDYKIQDLMMNPIAFQGTSDPDTMYWSQAMREPDALEFKKAAIKEFNDRSDREHWELMERKDVPAHKKVLPAVWSMNKKRDIKTRKITKYKAG